MYIDLQNPNPMSISVDCDWNTSIIRIFPLRGSLVGTPAMGLCQCGAFGTSRRPTMRAIIASEPKLTIGSEKLIHSTLFAAGGNNTLELIYHWTEDVDFFLFWNSR